MINHNSPFWRFETNSLLAVPALLLLPFPSYSLGGDLKQRELGGASEQYRQMHCWRAAATRQVQGKSAEVSKPRDSAMMQKIRLQCVRVFSALCAQDDNSTRFTSCVDELWLKAYKSVFHIYSCLKLVLHRTRLIISENCHSQSSSRKEAL